MLQAGWGVRVGERLALILELEAPLLHRSQFAFPLGLSWHLIRHIDQHWLPATDHIHKWQKLLSKDGFVTILIYLASMADPTSSRSIIHCLHVSLKAVPLLL